MELYLFRHGVAEDRFVFAESGDPDSKRPLTEDGIQKTHGAAKGLKKIVEKVDTIYSSTYIRAEQTAKILSKNFDKKVEIIDGITPMDDVEPLLKVLRNHNHKDRVMVVGHEPHLSQFVEYVIRCTGYGGIEIKKASCVHMRVDLRDGQIGGNIIWSLPPKVLRMLSD